MHLIKSIKAWMCSLSTTTCNIWGSSIEGNSLSSDFYRRRGIVRFESSSLESSSMDRNLLDTEKRSDTVVDTGLLSHFGLGLEYVSHTGLDTELLFVSHTELDIER